MLSRLLDDNSILTNEQLPRICAITIGLGLCVAIVITLFQFYESYIYQPVYKAENTSIGNQVTQKNYKAQTITRQNLFGQSGTVNIPTTQLRLTLRGAFTSTNPALSSAIIETPGKKTQSFKINSKVYGGASLHAVHNDRVVLSRGGQLETLYFPSPGKSRGSFGDSSQSMLSSSDVDLIKENATLGEVSNVARQLSSGDMTAAQRKQLIRQRLQELRNRSKK